MKESKHEAALAFQIKAVGLPAPTRELKFLENRRFRLDFAWPEHGKVFCEVHGGIWVRGRHNTGSGLESDCEKFTLATLAGWKGVWVTPRHIKEGIALSWIQEALNHERTR